MSFLRYWPLNNFNIWKFVTGKYLYIDLYNSKNLLFRNQLHILLILKLSRIQETECLVWLKILVPLPKHGALKLIFFSTCIKCMYLLRFAQIGFSIIVKIYRVVYFLYFSILFLGCEPLLIHQTFFLVCLLSCWSQ